MWGCSGFSTLLKLQKLQNRAARVLTNSAIDVPSSRPIKDLSGWASLTQLFESEQLVFKSLNNNTPHHICNLFKETLNAAHET